MINASGNILETEVEIKIDALLAKAYVFKNYAGQKIKELTMITDSKGVVTYEVEVKAKT